MPDSFSQQKHLPNYFPKQTNYPQDNSKKQTPYKLNFPLKSQLNNQDNFFDKAFHTQSNLDSKYNYDENEKKAEVGRLFPGKEEGRNEKGVGFRFGQMEQGGMNRENKFKGHYQESQVQWQGLRDGEEGQYQGENEEDEYFPRNTMSLGYGPQERLGMGYSQIARFFVIKSIDEDNIHKVPCA